MRKKIQGPFYLSDLSGFTKKMGILLLLFSLIRLLFLFINYTYFSDISFLQLLGSLLYAVRMDIASLLIFNGFLLLFITFFPRLANKYNPFCNFLFILINGGLFILYIIDNVFFEYTKLRISYDMFFLIPQSLSGNLLWIYISSHWYWALILLIAAFIFVRKIKWGEAMAPGTDKLGYRVIFARGIVVLLLLFVLIRGTESRPLSPSTALMYFPAKLSALIPNTGFNLLYSFYHGEKRMEDKNYFSLPELDKRFNIYHQFNQKDTLGKPNIVLFIMESFARDYLEKGNPFKASTPFLDSLMEKSLVFSNAFNNGNHSTHGLVAILAGLPPFMQEPYYHSAYYGIPVRGLGHILQERGYDCSFFLGDVDNSFGFKQFTRSIGITNYYGMKEFGNDKLHNGAWGIHDHFFFSFAADALSKKQTPFFSAIYNVSSHPPFIIPAEYKKQFVIPGQSAAQNSVSYVDYAYRMFFEKIKNESWYHNTVFVFIADHFYPPSNKRTYTTVSSNEIPFFIFSPANPQLKGTRSGVVQQMDVLPTILQLSGYNGRYMSFGKSVFEQNSFPYAVQERLNSLQIIDSSYALAINDEDGRVLYLYNYKDDPLLNTNLADDKTYENRKNKLSDFLKAMHQRYNYSFKHNKLYY